MLNKKVNDLGMKMVKRVVEYQTEGYGKKEPPFCQFIFFQPERPKSLKRNGNIKN